jgi:hypothetical protein
MRPATAAITAKTNLLSVRERGLIAIALWVIALIAVIFIWKQFAEANRTLKLDKVTIADHKFALERRDEITKDLAAHKERLDPSKTLSSANLQTMVSLFASQARLTPSFGSPRVEHKSGIQTTTLRVTFYEVAGTTIDKLLRFDDLLRARAQKIPIVLSYVSIQAGQRDNIGLTAVFDIQTYCINEKSTKK